MGVLPAARVPPLARGKVGDFHAFHAQARLVTTSEDLTARHAGETAAFVVAPLVAPSAHGAKHWP